METATPTSTPSASSVSETNTSTAASSSSSAAAPPAQSAGNALKEAMNQFSNPDGTKPIGKDAKPETAAEKAARKYRLKVDGVEEEVDLDSFDDATLVKELQMARAARKRMAEAAEVRKSFKSFMEQLQKDPVNTLKNKALGGIDIRKQIEDQILREYEESQLPPEQRKALELERKLAEREQQLQAIEQERIAAAQEQFNARVEQETEAELMQALQTSGLPQTRETLSIMAQVAKLNLQHGIELTPEQIAAETRARIQRMHGVVTQSLKGEALIKHLGDEVVKEVLRYKLQSAKQQAQETMKAPPPKVQQQAALDEPDRPVRYAKDARSFRKFVKGF